MFQYCSGPQSVTLRPAASAPSRNSLEMQKLGSFPDLLNQKFWNWISVSDSDAHSSVKATELSDEQWQRGETLEDKRVG